MRLDLLGQRIALQQGRPHLVVEGGAQDQGVGTADARLPQGLARGQHGPGERGQIGGQRLGGVGARADDARRCRRRARPLKMALSSARASFSAARTTALEVGVLRAAGHRIELGDLQPDGHAQLHQGLHLAQPQLQLGIAGVAAGAAGGRC